MAEAGVLNTWWAVSGWWLVFADLIIIITLVPTVILQRRESGATLAWVLVIVLIPFLGLFSFWLFGATRLKMRRRRRQRAEARLAPALSKVQRSDIEWGGQPTINETLLHLVKRLDGQGPLGGNDVTLYRDGALMFRDLVLAIDAATHHVHLIFYIWEADETGSLVRDALVRACGRGIEVRVLIDDVGARSAGKRFWRSLITAGGAAQRFLPVNFLSRHLTLNNRNHRKVVVIDGVLGFTGGMNVGDVYAGKAEPWSDLHARVSGPVASSLQEVFCQDWYHVAMEDLVAPRYFPPIAAQGEVIAQFLSSGPADGKWRSIHTCLFAAINLSCERVWIETPYFVPDKPVAMALQTAALRGVDVRLLLPQKSDHPLVSFAARSFFDDLLAAGVRIFLLEKTMPHAKAVVIDSVFSTVGSANMDQRSFRLNFEANMFFYNRTVAHCLEKDYLRFCDEAREMRPRHRRSLGRWSRLAENSARIMAPLL